MDWSDDVAYSVHDLEDAMHAGHLRLDVLRDPTERAALAELAARGAATDGEADGCAAALDRLLGAAVLAARRTTATHRALAALKNATSQLIGRFCQAAEDATREAVRRTARCAVRRRPRRAARGPAGVRGAQGGRRPLRDGSATGRPAATPTSATSCTSWSRR